MADPAFLIDDEEFPVPSAFRLGDPVLVTEITGMDWTDFAELLDEGSNDPRAMVGLLAVAVWQKHPGWKRERVARFVEQVPMDALNVTGADDDANPPVPDPATATTGDSPDLSGPEQESGSDETQFTTGVPA